MPEPLTSGAAPQTLIQQPITETRNLLAPAALLSQTIETRLLPPERLNPDESGEAVDMKKIGGNLVILRKKTDHYEADLYDARGNLTKITLDPSSHDLASISKKLYINKLGTTSDLADGIADMSTRSGYNPQTAQHLHAEWIAKCGSLRFDYANYIKTQDIKNSPRFFLSAGDWRLDVGNIEGVINPIFSVGPDKFGAPLEGQALGIKVELSADIIKDIDYSIPLSGGLKLRQDANLFAILDEHGREIGSYSGSSPVINPANPNQLFFTSTGRIYSLDINGVADRSSTPIEEQQIRVANIREIGIDNNGNFFVIRTSDNKLNIVDKTSGDVVKTIEDARGPVIVNEQGDILYVDTAGKVQTIQTNFQAISAGGNETAQKQREEHLQKLQERFANLELSKQGSGRAGISEEAVADTLRQAIARQIDEPLKAAASGEVVEDILDRLQAVKADPANQAYQEVVDEFINQARERLSGIRTGELNGHLVDFQKALDEVSSVGDTIGLDEQFAKLLGLRQTLDITDPLTRREIEQRIRTIQTKKDTIVNQYQGELLKAANETLPQLAELIKETGSTQELAYFSGLIQAQQFEMMLANIKDPQVRKELRGQYQALRAEQRGRLEESGRKIEEESRQRWAQVMEEAREDLTSLQEQIAELSDAKEIDRFGRNPLITAWRAKLFALPPELRAIEEQRLEIILGARKKDAEHRKELGAIGDAGELKFGDATFPIYKEPPRLWQPKFIPVGGLGWADLVFEDSQGRVFRPDGDNRVVVTPDFNDPKTARIVERYRGEADEHFRSLQRKVPDFDEHWRITDFHMSKLEEVAEALNLQIVNHRGILILQGEAGTGKNVLADMLANLSNREVIQIACNENTVKEDLTYEFYYDPTKGTYKMPSRLIEGLQTPGTIILWDEINALKPGIAKMMNSLFDYRRKILLPEGGKQREIMADPTVIFIGTMNPQNYGGVSRLSPEVKSRSRVVDIEYPPFEEQRNGRTYYRSDEAEMLAAYMDDLSEFKQTEFRQIWNYLINRDTSNGADRLIGKNTGIETDVRRVYDVIRVANRLREMYSAYQTGDSNEPMDFPTSLREVTDIVMEMNHRKGVKQMIKRVIIPKIDDRRQKRLVEQTIDAILPDTPTP